VQFEALTDPVGIWPGTLMQRSFPQPQVSLQLDALRSMGVNTITIELRTAKPCCDPVDNTFPACDVPFVLGLYWPQPPSDQLGDLDSFFTDVQSYGMKVILVLVNQHMEDLANSQIWLGSILNVVASHPSLDLVVFNGDAHWATDCNGTPYACGGAAEPGLWTGLTEYPAQYVQWAISYAMSLGIPSTKLSAGTIVGDYFTDSEPPSCPNFPSGHLWPPIVVMKQIFDNLNIPDNQRVYALSWYEHSKCATARGLPCVDESPPVWAEHTIQRVLSTIGGDNGARVVAYEMGHAVYAQDNWSTTQAIESLLRLIAEYGIDGGSFWRWVNYTDAEDEDPNLAEPLKRRCRDIDPNVCFNFSSYYTSAKTVLECYYTGACSLPRRPRPAPAPRPSPLHTIFPAH